ncbi:MAG: hypothetical protein HQM10_12850 [Candidatus Riflebacteria bacterium]|nr:hypothetical protein [Candidatus Riflebacteria bacterium]
MAKTEFGMADYISEAYNAKYVVPGLGSMPINKMILAIFFVMGIANVGFWFIGAAMEVLYLWMMATSPNFQSYVRGRNYKEKAKPDINQKLAKMVALLDDASNNKLKALNFNLSEIGRLMDFDSDQTADFMRETKLQSLNQLSVVFLRLLVSRKLIKESLQMTNTRDIKMEMADLKRQLENGSPSETLKRSLLSNLEIQEKRLENFTKADENLKIIELELDRIENQVQLIREQIAMNRTPEGLSSSIDRIGTTMAETEAWMNSNASFLNTLDSSDTLTPPPGARIPEMN